MAIFLEGIVLQAGLILALGAQNIFVLESGLRKNHPIAVAALCFSCDVVLIFMGVLGAASFILTHPSMRIGFGVVGVGFLFFYGVSKILEGRRLTETTALDGKGPAYSLKKSLSAALAFSLLNPHVYLDTLVLIPGYAAKFPALETRLIFGAGVCTFSGIWFFGLALLASKLSAPLSKPQNMKKVLMVAGFLLLFLSLQLGLDVWHWSVGN